LALNVTYFDDSSKFIHILKVELFVSVVSLSARVVISS